MSILRNRQPGRQPRRVQSHHPHRQPRASSQPFLDAALSFTARGWSVVPVIGKDAAVKWKPFQERPADEATVRRWFARPGITGLAVITGKVSCGLAIRDFDREDAYHSWAVAYPDTARLPTVRTTRGFHIYGTLPAETYADMGDGELRGDSGHYTVLPPSIHPEGAVYRWLIPLPSLGQPLPRLPDSLTQQTQDTQYTHPLIACVRQSTGKVATSVVEAAIVRTLPSEPGQRNTRVFELARALKRISPKARPEDLRGIVQDWHGRALPFVRTKDFSTTWIDFVVAWERIRAPEGARLAAIVANAKTMPTPPAALSYDNEPLRLLVALCATLQAYHGAGSPWPLSCRLAGETIGVSHDTAARMLKTLAFDGLLELATPAGPKGSRRAAEYRFVHGGAAL